MTSSAVWAAYFAPSYACVMESSASCAAPRSEGREPEASRLKYGKGPRGRGLALCAGAVALAGIFSQSAYAHDSHARMSWPSPPPMTIATDSVYLANMHTSKGNIVIRLNPSQAPITVNNFIFLARAGFYNGLRFHRVIPGFVIQGGDPRGTGQGGPGYTFPDELPAAGTYRIGSVAMANAGPDTNGSQFFIITGPQGLALPPAYALFGRVISGMSVARKIAQAPRSSNDAPRRPIIIRHIAVGVAP